MTVSILTPTYNRSVMLSRSIASVLKQDFQDWRLIVMDDCSTDDTQEVMSQFIDPRLRYVRATENICATQGDIAIYRKFLDEHCEGEFFIILCDDDYWLPPDLLSRQVKAMADYPSVAMVIGGVAQKFPAEIKTFPQNEPYIRYSHVTEKDEIFTGNLFPAGFLTGVQYLELFSDDPKNRNIVSGSTLFRTKSFRDANILNGNLGWQAGYAFTCGVAVNGGDVYYIDEPCLINRVDIGSASFRGPQARHFEECLCSIDSAFESRKDDPKMNSIRQKMAKNVFRAYLCNKIGHKFGTFASNPSGDISHIMEPPIAAGEFVFMLTRHDIPVSDSNLEIILASDLSADELRKYSWAKIVGMAA